ncbi:MAG: hypothetical protein GT598_15625 [Bacteroidales bacterium]|nr:hypothetical protein [Bacteroidales bacterium]
MCSAECDAIIQGYNENYKNGWEQTRYIAYVIAATNSDKIKSPKDLLSFTWEIEEEKEIITKEERLKREQEMLDWLAKQK